MNSQPTTQYKSQMAHSLLFKNKSEILSILGNDENLSKKIKCVEILVDKFIPDLNFNNLEEEVFSILLPAIRGMLNSIFIKNLELLETCSSNILEIQQYIQMCLQLLDAVSSILNLILSKEVCDISSIESIPTNIPQIIYSCFQHCKENNNRYHSINLLTEILIIFKKGQEVHGKLLKILEFAEIDALLENEKEYILSESLCDIGEILSGMNVKSMTETWKSYVIFTKKFSNTLSDVMNIGRPLSFISSEVMKSLNTISSNMDDKVVSQTLKISSFLLKVAIKLFENFWEICRTSQPETLKFFCTIYSYTKPYAKDVYTDHKELINYYIYNNLETVLLKLFHLSWTEKLENLDLSMHVGFINMTSNILPNLDIENNFGILLYYLKLILKSLEGGRKLEMEDDIYTNFVTSFSSKLLSVSGEEYFSIEEVLLDNVLCGNICQSLMASDIWILTLRHAPPTISYDTILNILEKIHSKNVDPSSGYIILGHVIRNLYSNLPNGLKVKVVDKYPPETQPDVWKLIGFRNLPASKCFLKNVNVDNLCKRLDQSHVIRWDKKDVMNVIWMMEMLSTLDISIENVNKNRLCECLLKLWEFNVDNHSQLFKRQIFIDYITRLCMITMKTFPNFSNSQLNQVLKQLRIISSLTPVIRILISKILMIISNKSPNDQNINDRVSVLVKNLTNEDNGFLKVLITLSHNSLKRNWGTALDLNKDFVDEVVKNKKIRLDDFEPSDRKNEIEQNTDCETERTVTYKGKYKSSLPTPSYLVSKKDAEEDIQDILDQMKNDVKTLIKYSAQGKLKIEDSKEIFSIISKLNQLV